MTGRRTRHPVARAQHLLEIALACLIVPCLLELLPATRTLALLRRIPARRLWRGAVLSAERVAWLVDRLLRRAPWLWRHTCLRRAAVLMAVLRRDGHPVEVVLGVRRSAQGALEAHAWITRGTAEPWLEPGPAITFEPLTPPRRAHGSHAPAP
jgi:hypothetical protein